jgi:hypothetical protein
VANKIRTEDFADILQWAALALFIVFLAILLAAMLPLQILDSRWQVRVISALLGSASLPLMGVVLMMLSNYLDDGVSPFGSKIALLRRLAGFAAIGFLLLIPLQIAAGSRLLNQQSGNEVGQLKVLQRSADAIRSATNEADLKNALRQLPGAPTNLDRPGRQATADPGGRGEAKSTATSPRHLDPGCRHGCRLCDWLFGFGQFPGTGIPVPICSARSPQGSLEIIESIPFQIKEVFSR